MREERIAEKSAERAEWRRLYDMIGKLLFDHGLEPSPANFELCHRYLSGRDGELNAMIDKAIAKDGSLSEAVTMAISAKLDPGLSTDELSRIAIDAQSYLEQMTTILAKSGDDARDYGVALAQEAEGLETAATPALSVKTLVDLTKSMIEKAQAAEDDLRRTEMQMTAMRKDLAAAHHKANSDPLTGLPNRRALDQHLRAAFENARRANSPLALAICDIDHFKQFNDTHGHQIGDEVIKFVGSSLGRAASNGDVFVARYGGEEFVMVFERGSVANAMPVLDKIRAAIAARELKVTNTGQSLGRLSFSGGLATINIQDSPGSILKRADAALYKAKQDGRNRITAAD
ncbi:GGDEF domain-containing protein [Sphingomonadaceae bacterium G21617-S1]|uniref:GGDEF domain-containing protein n=1 Tax=Rhizorhabdus sp. TaxID=1968843 RepID=UPI0011F8E569|nr:GGDEF domain-containing protein [Rhizorhabdus sp.]MBD3760441.1 GGDEF domain-containing protein [Rhizorhabdus sp.]MCZ4340048.1 GGDEF domain-containing protein [Sphingomonadaceae bacterium G21617-S1]TAK06440.1 MAG: GGDEF domain-containing protein [Rhizorhabdus sp.]